MLLKYIPNGRPMIKSLKIYIKGHDNDMKIYTKWQTNDMKIYTKWQSNDMKIYIKWQTNDMKIYTKWQSNDMKIYTKWQIMTPPTLHPILALQEVICSASHVSTTRGYVQHIPC